MKYYDFKKAKELILEAKKEFKVKSADLGMEEDWLDTSEEIYNNENGFVVDLDTVATLNGINGSHWATPILRIYFRGSTGLYKDHWCYTRININE